MRLQEALGFSSVGMACRWFKDGYVLVKHGTAYRLDCTSCKLVDLSEEDRRYRFWMPYEMFVLQELHAFSEMFVLKPGMGDDLDEDV